MGTVPQSCCGCAALCDLAPLALSEFVYIMCVCLNLVSFQAHFSQTALSARLARIIYARGLSVSQAGNNSWTMVKVKPLRVYVNEKVIYLLYLATVK